MTVHYVPMADPTYTYPTRVQHCPHVELAYAEGWTPEMADPDFPWCGQCDR